MTGISLANNNLKGILPEALSNLRALTSLDLSTNELHGSISPQLAYIPGLTSMNVNGNDFHDLADNLLDLTSLTTLDLGDNQLCLLTPTMAAWTDTYDPDWQSTQQCDYRYIDSLSLVDLYAATDGPNWTNTWNLADPLDTWYGVIMTTSRVTQVILGNNNLKGYMPSSLGNLRELQELDLSCSDTLSGGVPSELSYITGLSILYLQHNQLETLGPLVVNLTGLTSLNLGNNKICDLAPELAAWATVNDPDWHCSQACD